MCDSIECMEILTTILNIYIPEILPNVNNYVIKGGRASDYYISKSIGEDLIRFTDWDIACDGIESQNLIKDRIIEYLSQHGILNIKIQSITTSDNKSGIQLGINCNTSDCYFADIVIYNPDDPIFSNIQTNNNIRYINIDYLLSDLQETYKDRVRNLSYELYNFHITNIDINNLNNLNNSIDFYMGEISIQLIKNYSIKSATDIVRINKYKDLDQQEKMEEIEGINKSLQDGIRQMYSEILPKFKNSFEKLIRTADRLKKINKILNIKGGKKMKTKKRNKTLKKRNIKLFK
jgi:hypothetical protein